jgi:hypothetical protein
MALHEALPQSMTPENLGEWINSNSIDTNTHIEEILYTEEEIKEFEHKSSLASRSIDEIEAVEKKVKEMVKEGIDEPVNVTIPPTKGTKILKENRLYADEQILKGFNEVSTPLFGIPYPEKGKVLWFDIEGNLFEQYTTDMTPEQFKTHGTLFNLQEAIEDEKSEGKEKPFTPNIDKSKAGKKTKGKVKSDKKVSTASKETEENPLDAIDSEEILDDFGAIENSPGFEEQSQDDPDEELFH